MKRVYMAGSGGMLGDGFYHKFKGDYEVRCTDIDVNSEWLSYSDFRDRDKYRKDVVDFKPDYLFHLGAHTDLEYCEVNSDDSYQTNTLAVENAVHIANDLDIPLLYITTAGVFDGEKDTYDDWDEGNPLGVYARSKYQGELYVKQTARTYLICRAGWMMGGGPNKDKKFVQKIMKQIKDGKKELYVVNDKLGTPTYTHDFAANTKVLIEEEYWGLYNMVCEGITGRFEVAQEIVKILNLDDTVKVTEVSSDFFKTEYFATRPASERLINRRLTLRGLNQMRDWRIGLTEYLNSAYADYL